MKRRARCGSSGGVAAASRRALLRALAGVAAWPVTVGTARAQAPPAAAVGGERRIPYPDRDEVQVFIRVAAAEHDLDPDWIARWLRAARYSPRAEQLMQPQPPAQRHWGNYRARTLDARRIAEGRAFLVRHRPALERATSQWGVPGEIVVAILGVETFYGRLKGTFPVLDVLATLSFDYTRRAELFQRELGEFLRLCREQKVDPRVVLGSFAGAIGLPQFLPSSIRRHAVDFDGDGRIDIVDSPADAIGSVAAFLAAHGWQRDTAVAFAASTSEEDDTLLGEFGGGITPNVAWRELAFRGVEIDGALELDTPVLLVDLPQPDAEGNVTREWRVATANFCAILHYNRSYFYAASVQDLAQALLA